MFEELVGRVDAAHARVGAAHRELPRLIADVDRCGAWEDDGARDVAHWIGMRYGVSEWKARRWVVAAHALDALPRLSAALADGTLGVDKVVELTRFATPETEQRLIAWAGRVSCGAVRRRGDLETRRTLRDAADVERDRRLSWWWFDEGRRLGLEAELPAAQGAIVAKALERVAETLPPMPGEEGAVFAYARRADALVAMCAAGLASEADPDRATVVVHAQAGSRAGAELECGGVVDRRPWIASSATRGPRRSWKARTARSSRSAGCRGSPRRGCFVRSGTATANAGSPAAAHGASQRPITSSGGEAAAGRTSTISC